MKKGLIHSLIYYGICIVIFIILSLVFEQPRHFPGLNYMFLFLLLIIGFIIITINLIQIIKNKNNKYNIGALIIHFGYAGGLISWYLIGYYSQFK